MPRIVGQLPGESSSRRSRIAAVATLGLISLGLLSAQAAPKTYVWYDKEGRAHYSDRPQTGAEEVVLPPAQTYTAPAASTTTKSTSGSGNRAPTEPGVACRILSPTSEETIVNQPSVTITAQGPQRATPTLRLNGASINSLDGRPVFTVTPIPRGTYTATVVFTGMTGGISCQTATVTFYVRQPTVIKPPTAAPRAPARS